jgi:hypothetical protein
MAETQTVENITRLAPFMEDYTRKLLESAYQQTQTGGTTPALQVAGLTPEQLYAGSLATSGIGAYQPYLNMATGMTANPNAYQAYMSPFTSSVIDEVGKDIMRQTTMQQNMLGSQAATAGAFGGSRAGIAQGEIGRAGLDAFADASAKLREAGFMNAQNLVGQRSGQLANLAGLGQQFGQQDISNLLGIGSLYQGQNQAILDAQRATALQQMYEPYQRIGFFSDILRGVPTTQSSLSVGTSPSQSPLSQIAGIAATGLGIAGNLGWNPLAKTA